MPKMRGFKPEIWTDDKFVNLSPLARLLFMGLWNYACDNGHVEKNPRQLKLRILPADDCDVLELLEEIITERMADDHDDHLHIPKLRVHQRIDNRYFTACEHCDPAEVPESTRRAHAGNTSGTRRAPTLKEGSEGDECEGDGESSAAGAPRKRAIQLPDAFRPTDAHLALAAEQGVDLRAEWPQFVDHHRAKGTTMKDWDAGLRTWIRNAAKFRRGATPPPLRLATNGEPIITGPARDDVR